MKRILTLLLLVASISRADTPPPGTVKIKGGSDGTTIGNVSDSQKVSVTNSSIPVTGTFFQATQPVSGNVGRLWTLLNTQDSVNAVQSGTWTVGVSNFPSSFSVSNFPATQPISASSLPLPTGAASESTLSSLNSKVTTTANGIQVDGSGVTQPISGSVSVSNFPVTQPVSGSVSVSNFPATQPVSAASLPLPSNAAQESGGNLATIASNTSGLATSAAQSTGNSSLSTIATNTTGVATAANQTTANSTLSTISTNLNNAATGRTSISLMRNSYSGTNVTTSAYVQLVASTSDQINYLDVFDSSGQTLALAIGGLGSEVNQFYIVPGGNGPVPLKIPAGSRISVIAISGTASSGELDITGYK